MYPESTMRRTSDRSRWNVTRVYERRVSPDHRYCGARAARTGHSLLEKPRPDGAQWGPGDGHTECYSDEMHYVWHAVRPGEIVPLIAKLLLWFNPWLRCDSHCAKVMDARFDKQIIMEWESLSKLSIRWSRDVIMLKRWIQRMLIQSYVTGSSTHWQKKFNEAENL